MSLTQKQRNTLRLILIYLACAVVLFWALAPIYWVVVSSISTRIELYAAPYKIWFPSQPTFQNYIDLFTTGPKYRDGGFLPTADLMSAGMRNSLVSGVSTAVLVTILSTLAGYVFARIRFRGKGPTFFYLMLMMPLPVWVSLIAMYFLLAQLNLLDSIGGLVMILLVFQLPLGIWLMTTYVREIPYEIQDAALVDGCNRWQLLRSIIFPLARPGMAAVFLVALLTTWNSFLIPTIFTSSAQSQPLTVVLSLFIGQYEVAWESMAAAAVVTMLPPLLLALFFQRYLVQGLTMGAVNQ
jgi:multiple sugar transport system permease protein